VSGLLNAPAALPPGKTPGFHWIGGWVDPGAGLDDVERRKILPVATSDCVIPAPDEYELGLVDSSVFYWCYLNYQRYIFFNVRMIFWLWISKKFIWPTLRKYPVSAWTKYGKPHLKQTAGFGAGTRNSRIRNTIADVHLLAISTCESERWKSWPILWPFPGVRLDSLRKMKRHLGRVNQ
jgi:hypothetical protein